MPPLIAVSPFRLGKYISAFDNSKLVTKTRKQTMQPTFCGYSQGGFFICNQYNLSNGYGAFNYWAQDADDLTFATYNEFNRDFLVVKHFEYSPKTGYIYAVFQNTYDSTVTDTLYIAASGDGGATWDHSAIAMPASANWGHMGFDDDNDTIIVTAATARFTSPNYTYRSTDRGASWTNISTTPGNVRGYGVQFLKKFNRYVKRTSTTLLVSDNVGASWTSSGFSVTNTLSTLLQFGDRLVILNNTTSNQLLFSDDGLHTLIPCNLPSGYSIKNIIFGAGLYVAFCANNLNLYFYSNDMINWTAGNWPIGVTIGNGAYGNGKFFLSDVNNSTKFYTYTV